MCGRYTLTGEDDNMDLKFILNEIRKHYPERPLKIGEIFPTDTAPIVISGSSGWEPSPADWGFPLGGKKEVVINARSETAMEKRMFREDLLFRRCVVPAAGFFEWSRTNRQKYLFRLPDASLLYMGGLYERTEASFRFVILTTQSNPSVSEIHHRMPIVFHRDLAEKWITTESPLDLLKSEMPALHMLSA